KPKRKKAKKDVFTVNLYYDGLFTSCPIIYFQGQCKVLTHTNFDEMTYVHLLEILKRLVPNGFEKVYYCKSGVKLTSIREIKYIVDMLKVGYDNGLQIDMYVDHFGYDIMKMVEYFHTEGDDSVVIKNITTQDPLLTKLRSARILFRGHVEFGVDEETPQVDPDDNQIDPVYKIKKGVVYPAFDPDIVWDKIKPILGMRFKTPHQLEMALENYGVAHGYQLWTRLFRGDEGNQAVKKPVDEAPKHETSDDRPVPEQGKSPAVDKCKAKTTVEDGPTPERDKLPAVDKGKTKVSVEDRPALKKKKGRPPSSVDGIRIYHKNRGRSERIANMKLNKPFQFDKFGTGSTPDKAFDVKE
nr:F-box domain, leucine-rich repeat domain, L domain-like protein [Tanacetum cinerariifolium]